ncbi:MAG: GTPase ObgE [Candidatus Omnitrophota bacterium]
MFIDRAKVFIKAGDGGDGCRSYYRDKWTRHPIPNGGDGGDGADVIMRADSNLQTLYDFKYQQHFRGKDGRNGSSKDKKGKTAPPLLVLVPRGTLIKDASTLDTLRDLAHPGEEVIVAKGGRGGRGNWTKKEATNGKKGEEKTLLLELKLVADVGIIGYPNAGKSTLISKITNARPKIADYPFTTKAPLLGVVKLPEGEFVMADIPGIIEGAHSGKGLGLDFLRHIERTRILVHLIDMAGVDGRLPRDDYANLNRELESYSKLLVAKPQIVVANKMDLEAAQTNMAVFKNSHKVKCLAISAIKKEGTKELIWEIWKSLKELKE